MNTQGVSAAEAKRFDDQGFIFPIRVLDEDQVRGIRAILEDRERMEGGKLSLQTNRKPHLLMTRLAALVRDPRVLDAVEALIGPNILCWGSDFFTKAPGDGKIVSWHQDSTYWGLSPPSVVSVWIALSASTPESGCLRVIPGSHREAQLPHRNTYAENNLLSRGQEVAVQVEEDRAVDIVLKPGEASIHHVRLVHGSQANKSNDRRIGFVIRYLPTHVKQEIAGRDSATLVRGVDLHNNFDLEPAPESDFHPDAVAAHARIIEAQGKILFRGAKVGFPLRANTD